MTIFSTRITFILSILFLSSCMSSKQERELLKVENNDPVNNVVKLIQNHCYEAKRPQFLADVSTENMKTPPFVMEGIWENNYNLLKASVIGPLGEEYLSFDIDGYKLNYNNQSDLFTSNDHFGQISSLLSKIGAKELRNFLCGRFAFQIFDKNDGVFIVKEKLNEESLPELIQKTEISKSNYDASNKKYFSISTMNISGYNIEVQSSVSLTKKGNGYGVIVNSRFYYGPFSQNAQIEVKWAGFVNSTDVFPTSTVFRTKEETYEVNFSEYQ